MDAPERSGRRPFLAVAAGVGLALVVFGLHGRSVDYGLFLDDYAHYRQLKEADWSLAELTAACRLELVGGVIDYWWLPECTLRFFRPLAFGLMKLTYILGDWQPTWMHWASLFWHALVACLLMALVRRLGAPLLVAWLTAGLFTIHPAHVATVQWIAAQSELMVTTFLLCATLAVARFRGWSLGEERRSAGGPLAAVAAIVAFVAALGCRENAIMFPALVLTGDVLFRAKRTRGALAFYVGLGVICVGYLALRSSLLGGMALPPRPYVTPPTDPGFVRYIIDKAGYYLLGEFILAPCVPIGGMPYLRAHAGWFYLLVALVVAGIALVVRFDVRRRIVLFGAAWLVLFMGPLLPAFESPHHLYLPGVGWALIAWRLWAVVAGYREGLGRPGALRVAWSRVCVAGALALFGTTTFFLGMSMSVGGKIEDALIHEVATSGEIRDGDTLYFVNLPILGHYVKLAVEDELGVRDLNVIALTWSPRLFGVTNPSERIQIDPRTIEVRVRGNAYFSGPAGLLVEQARALAQPLGAGFTLERKGVRIEALEEGEGGVLAFRFRLPEPLSAPHVHFFWGSSSSWAMRIPPGLLQ